MRCGFLIKSRGCQEHETDFPPDKSYKWKTSAAPVRPVPHPAPPSVFTSLYEMFVIIPQTPFKNKQTHTNEPRLVTIIMRGAIYPLGSVLTSGPFVVRNWNHSADCEIKWQLPCLCCMKHCVFLKQNSVITRICTSVFCYGLQGEWGCSVCVWIVCLLNSELFRVCSSHPHRGAAWGVSAGRAERWSRFSVGTGASVEARGSFPHTYCLESTTWEKLHFSIVTLAEDFFSSWEYLLTVTPLNRLRW